MSYADDMGHRGPIDEDDDWDWARGRRAPPKRSTTCARCGTEGLRWQELTCGWRLFDAYEMHLCRSSARSDFAFVPLPPPEPEPEPKPTMKKHSPALGERRGNEIDAFVWWATGKCRRING